MADLVEEKQHARLSPSAAKRWMTCPGSIKLIEAMNIVEKPSKYAAEGTVAHEVGELCLRECKEPKEYLGKTIEADGMKFKVNQNMVDAVTEYTDYIRDHIEQAEIQSDTNVELQVEVRCSLKSLGVPGLDGGTSDALLINREHQYIEVADYKHGQGVAVEAIDNPQAMCYALGAMIALDIKYEDSDMWEIWSTIVQPRAHHPDGRIRTHKIMGNELYNWAEDKLIPAAKAVHGDDPVIQPSEDGCRFCAAAGNCPALYDKTQEVAIADFADDSFPEPATMTPDQKILVMDHIGMLRSYLLAVENQVKLEMDAGSQEYSDKYKLVQKATQRRLTEDALDELCSPLLDYMDDDEFYTKKPKGIGDLEKTLKEKLKEQGVKGFTKIAKEIMGDITYKPEGELVVAPISDKRKGVQPSVVGDFANLDD